MRDASAEAGTSTPIFPSPACWAPLSWTLTCLQFVPGCRTEERRSPNLATSPCAAHILATNLPLANTFAAIPCLAHHAAAEMEQYRTNYSAPDPVHPGVAELRAAKKPKA